MSDWRRRISYALVAGGAVVLLYALGYQWTMATYEGQHVTFFQAVQTVTEVLTTAGFGGDTEHWNTNQVNLLVIAMNLSGVLLVFLALPLFAVPLFREALETSPPRESDMTNHVIICGHSDRDEVLGNELEAAGIPYLYVDADPETVRDLRARGVNAIYGDTEQVATLEAANAPKARAIVADVDDEVNPTVILSASRANPLIQIVSVVRDTEVAAYHQLAGADEVVKAPQVLGESLGMRAVTSFAEKFRAALGVESDLQVTELLVEENSKIAGQTLRGTTVFGEMGATVIGGWFDGKFLISPGPETTIEENTILLVVGDYEDFAAVKARPLPTHDEDPARVVVCGHGVVGKAVAETLSLEGIDYDVIDIEDHEGTDVIGDVTDPATLLEADVRNTRSIVLALDKDTTTVYATLVCKRLAPDVEIIARVHDPDNVWKLYNAGADFVLSMAVVTGEMLASHLVEEREILTAHAEFEFARRGAPELAGRTLSEVDVRARTGCTVVAVERDGELIGDLGANFTIEAEDVLVISGSENAVERFDELRNV